MIGKKPFLAVFLAALLITEPVSAAAVSAQEMPEHTLSSNSGNAVWEEESILPEAEVIEDSGSDLQEFTEENIGKENSGAEISQDNETNEANKTNETDKKIDLSDQETLDWALAEGLVEFQPAEEVGQEPRAGAANGDIVDIASREVGVFGRPNKYTYWLGTIAGTYSYAWCHAFVSWCGAQTGSSQVPRTASCFYGAQEFRAQGRWQNRISGYVPKSGDIIYFDWNANGGYDHVGIVNYVSGGQVYTIEGNSGDAVRRSGGYALTDSQIIGYGTPDYALSATAQGCLDSVTGGACCVKVRGWAFDRKAPEQALRIHVYVGGKAGSGAPAYTITADQERADVGVVYPGVGDYHGFDASILVSKTGSQPVYVYAVSAAKGDKNPLIGSGTVKIKKDAKAPVIKKVKVKDISAEGYTVTCKVTDNVGVEKVEFLAWHESESREQAVRFAGTVEDNAASCFIPIEALGNRGGSYVTYICASDCAGNMTEAAADTVAIDLMSLSPYKMQNLSSGFLASIETPDGEKALDGQEDTVSVQAKAGQENQIWAFERADDGSYQIRLTSSGTYLAADSGVYLSDQEEAHFWQIYRAQEGSYYLNPQGMEERVLGVSQEAVILDTFQAAQEQRFCIRKLSTNVESLQLNKSSLSLAKAGQTKNLTALVWPESAADEKICWTTSNAKVAAVDKNGVVTAVENGTAAITAATEDGSITAACSVTVQVSEAGAGGKVKSGSYTYCADFVRDTSGTKTVIYRQRSGGAKKELAQVQAKAYLKLVFGKKLYYEEAAGSGKRNLCAIDTKTFQIKTVRLNASIIDSYKGRFLIKPYSAKTKPKPCYLFYAATGKETRISVKCLAARITKSKIYYVKAVSGNNGKGWPARVHSCNLSGGRDKYLTGKLIVADCKKLTGKSIVYQSGKTWYEYTYASKKKKKI